MAMNARGAQGGAVQMPWGTLEAGIASATLAGTHHCLAAQALYAFGDMDEVLAETGRGLRGYWLFFGEHARTPA